MKNALVLLLLMPFVVFAQTKEELDFISPMHDGVVAIKKGNLWGFIDSDGQVVIDFRDDLVLTQSDDKSYPIFKNSRCLIKMEREGISYFGYIDKSGQTIIEAEYLNAQNFNKNQALVLKVKEEALGRNEILGKDVISHKYFEVLIDENGAVKRYLNPEGIPVVLDEKSLKKPPKITSYKISKNLYAVLNQNKKWIIVKRDN